MGGESSEYQQRMLERLSIRKSRSLYGTGQQKTGLSGTEGVSGEERRGNWQGSWKAGGWGTDCDKKTLWKGDYRWELWAGGNLYAGTEGWHPVPDVAGYLPGERMGIRNMTGTVWNYI